MEEKKAEEKALLKLRTVNLQKTAIAIRELAKSIQGDVPIDEKSLCEEASLLAYEALFTEPAEGHSWLTKSRLMCEHKACIVYSISKIANVIFPEH